MRKLQADWRFADGFDERRRALLTDPRRSFERVVTELCAGAVVCARWEWGRDREISGRVRVAFELQASEDTVDVVLAGARLLPIAKACT